MPKLSLVLLPLALLAACASSPAPRHPAQSPVPTPGPELSAELKLFDAKNMYPADRADGSTEGYYGWASCFSKEYNRAPIRMKGSELSEECRPDTLYSWQEDRAVKGLESAAAGPRRKDSFPQGSIYTHVNPVATYAYGFRALRFKLKPATKFKVYFAEAGKEIDYCKQGLSNLERANTVAVRVFNGGTDYLLCSPGPIESWSENSKVHYDEIVSSALWYFRQSAKHGWIPYRNFFPAEAGEAPSPLFISDDEGRDFDGHSFTEDQLAQQLKFLRADSGAGRIFYAPGVSADPARHFATAKPIYWNHRGLSTAPAPNAPAEAGTATHRDQSCGFRVSYPSALFKEEPNGAAFAARANEREASFDVDCEKVSGKSLKDLYGERVVSDPAVSYKTLNAGKNFFVSSGLRGQMIFYTKSILVGGTLKTLFITYNAAAKAQFDAAVALISKSFASE